MSVPASIGIGAVFGLAASLCGCMVGPEPVRPPNVAAETQRFTHSLDPSESEDADFGQWWLCFGDDVTNQLVREVLKENTQLQVAAARILEAQADLKIARGAILPQLSGSPRAIWARISPEDRQNWNVHLYQFVVNIGWQVDLWGKLRRQAHAAESGLSATQAEAEAIMHSVVAQTISGRILIADFQRRIEIARANVANRKHTLEAVERRYLEGLGSAVDLYLARQNFATARAQIPELQQNLAQAHHALDVLRGQAPGTSAALRDTLPPVPELPPPPAGLPAHLLDRRPDLRASEMRSMAATHQIGMRVADLLPSLTLTSTLGYSSLELGQLIDTQGSIYTLILDTAQPLFQGGMLLGRIRQAEARASQAAAEYAGSVLQSMQEVEDALVAENRLREQLDDVIVAYEQVAAAEELARSLYIEGIGDILRVFEAERGLYESQARMSQLQAALWLARVDLHLAIGGDWGVDLPTARPPATRCRADAMTVSEQ